MVNDVMENNGCKAKRNFKISNLEVLMNKGDNSGNDCTFFAYEQDGKLVLRSKKNNRFLQRVYRYYDM